MGNKDCFIGELKSNVPAQLQPEITADSAIVLLAPRMPAGNNFCHVEAFVLIAS